MNLATYKNEFKIDQAVGALSIEKKLKEMYGSLEPRFYTPQVMSFQGGEDPIDGVAIYDHQDYYHMVSYGMSQLYYSEESVDQEFSKWGFEFSFRLRPFAADENEDPFWAIQLMNNLGRFVNETKVWLEEYQFMPLGGPMRADTDTTITGVAFIQDPDLGEINTPHGKVIFLQMIGLTDQEVKLLEADPSKSAIKKVIDDIMATNPKLICQL